MNQPVDSNSAAVDALFEAELSSLQRTTDIAFAYLMLGQWVFGIVCAIVVSPWTWEGTQSSPHVHLWAAIVLGGATTLYPAWLVYRRRSPAATRMAMAMAQVCYSALLIHLMGGRIEAHFHIFGSLALLAFYRDPRIYLPAVSFVLLDHVVRGLYWPESVFGVVTPTAWRALEHAAWVVFESAFLIWGIAQGRQHIRRMAELQVSLEEERDKLEDRVAHRTQQLAASKQQLEQRTDILDAVMNSVSEGIVAATYSGELLCFNRGAEGILGKSAEESTQQEFWTEFLEFHETTTSKRVEEFNHPLLRATLGESIENHALEVRRPDGEAIVLACGTPLKSAVSMAGVLTLKDVTQQHKLQKQLMHSQKMESIGQLASGIAHEINTPMQYISTNLSYLRRQMTVWTDFVETVHAVLGKDFLDQALRQNDQVAKAVPNTTTIEQSREALDDCQLGIDRVVEIISAMKNFAHPGTDARTSVDVNRCIRDAAIISKNNTKRYATVELDLQECGNVLASASGLNQTFVNLLVNAADAIEDVYQQTQQLGRILVTSRRCHQIVEIKVSDTGCGMNPELVQRAFEPFFTTKEIGRGSGQGLAIAYNAIVEQSGGYISIDSAPGEGTTFTIHLTSAEATDEPDFPVDELAEV